ncbi:RBBP9/YdeN family alpha/beta hydrolase [Algoriphagus terrigena]|uniref:RBBP9/YdeN family alpha/beta hydrolase n=1 Tax=Algoriphagus terrigena TaxID=344884 RepID=UPI000416BD5A|nr:alpha/beta hydrolase [Algoriphagus terrigena]
MNNYLIIPGLGNSGPTHWQTYFEKSGKGFQRVEQEDWNTPDCADWIKKIDEAIETVGSPDTVVLVGHSLGCIAIAHWAARYKRKIKGAMLVAPSDVESANYVFDTTGFSPIPLNPLGFKSTLVASTNDQWVSLDRAIYFADKWGSKLINIGPAGHINVSSGHTTWDLGLEILKAI